MILNGVDFGVYTIADEDWAFISAICEREEYRTALEFGGGISTVYFSEIMDRVECVETDLAWIEKIKEAATGNVSVHLPSGAPLVTPVDVVFVDGPFFSSERDKNVQLAGVLPGVMGVFLHDSHEPWIVEYGCEYLAKRGFTQVEFGGSVYIADPPGTGPYEGRYRCSYWSKNRT